MPSAGKVQHWLLYGCSECLLLVRFQPNQLQRMRDSCRLWLTLPGLMSFPECCAMQLPAFAVPLSARSPSSSSALWLPLERLPPLCHHPPKGGLPPLHPRCHPETSSCCGCPLYPLSLGPMWEWSQMFKAATSELLKIIGSGPLPQTYKRTPCSCFTLPSLIFRASK